MPDTATPVKPAFFTAQGGNYMPQRLASNPWFDNAVAGGPISALFGHIIEQAGLVSPGFTVARMTIDILGIVPSALLEPTITSVRTGRQMQLHHISLSHAGRLVAQAQVLIVRELDSPAFTSATDAYPDPDTLADGPFLVGSALRHAMRTRPVLGSVMEPGRGIVWMTMDAPLVADHATSPFVKACMFADFGNGVGCSTRADQWSFANLDVSIQFLRMPRGDWFLLDAHTVAAGNGHALARSTFADRDGVYALGTQTIFVAPGANTPKMANRAEAPIG